MSKRRMDHVWLALPLMATACSATAARQSEPEQTAQALAVPEGHQLAFEYQAVGVQIYACTPSATGDAQWVLTAPDATLYDRKGYKVASHDAGPRWTANDGSRVVATKAAADGGDATAIPWLLLRATEHSGTGTFSTVSYVQRLRTRAGLAPSGSCDPNASCGNPVRVPYAATYAFYVPRRP